MCHLRQGSPLSFLCLVEFFLLDRVTLEISLLTVLAPSLGIQVARCYLQYVTFKSFLPRPRYELHLPQLCPCLAVQLHNAIPEKEKVETYLTSGLYCYLALPRLFFFLLSSILLPTYTPLTTHQQHTKYMPNSLRTCHTIV